MYFISYLYIIYTKIFFICISDKSKAGILNLIQERPYLSDRLYILSASALLLELLKYR